MQECVYSPLGLLIEPSLISQVANGSYKCFDRIIIHVISLCASLMYGKGENQIAEVRIMGNL